MQEDDGKAGLGGEMGEGDGIAATTDSDADAGGRKQAGMAEEEVLKMP